MGRLQRARARICPSIGRPNGAESLDNLVIARGAEDLRKSAGDRQAVQDAGDRQSPEGPRRDDRHGLMGGVVDNGQALQG